MSESTPKFTSRYVPFDPDGPLPPGLSPDIVRMVYRYFGLSSREVLKAAGVRGRFMNPNATLRRMLDDPAFRKRLAGVRLPNGAHADFAAYLFHFATFGPTGRVSIAARYLGYFSGRLEFRRRYVPILEKYGNYPLSEGELRHVLDGSFRDRSGRPPAGPPPMHEVAIPLPPPPRGEKGGELVGAPQLIDPALEEVIQRSSFGYAEALSYFLMCMAWFSPERCHAFMIHVLTKGEAFQRYFGAEVVAEDGPGAAGDGTADVRPELAAEVIPERAAECREETPEAEGIPDPSPTPSNDLVTGGPETAGESAGTCLEETAGESAGTCLEETAGESAGFVLVRPATTGAAGGLEDEAAPPLEAAGEGSASPGQTVVSESADLAALRALFQDCAGPLPAASIRAIDREPLLALLELSRHERPLRILPPLVIRALGEVDGWAAGEVPEDGLELVRAVMHDARTDGRAADLRAMPGYLTERMVQGLLEAGDPEVCAHLTLFALRESLGRAHPFFFHIVWPCAGWRQRSTGLGERLPVLFDALHRHFLREGTVEAVVVALRACRLERVAPPTPAGSRGHGPASRPALRLARAGTDPHAAGGTGAPSGTGTSGAKAGAYPPSSQTGGPAPTPLADPLVDAIQRAVNRLPAPGERTRDEHWIEHAVADLLDDLIHDRLIELSPAFLGELPPLATLFRPPPAAKREGLELIPDGHETSYPLPVPGMRVRAIARWPGWLEASPASERLWMARTHGADWQDLLQEALARAWPEERRAPQTVLEAMLAAGLEEAVIEASRYPGFDSDGARAVVARAQAWLARRERARRRIDALTDRLDRLPRGDRPTFCERVMENLVEPILEAIEAIERRDLELAEERVTYVAWRMAFGDLKTVCELTRRDLMERGVEAPLAGRKAAGLEPG